MLSFTRLHSGPSRVTLATDGAAVVRRYGRAGALGPPERIECGSEIHAQRAQHRIAQRLMRKGYAAGHHHPGLIDAIAQAPDDPAGYAVYADWLAARGDPRADLIAATQTPKRSRSIRGLLDAHPYHFQHDLWGRLDLIWWMGFVRGVEFLTNWSVQHRGDPGTRWPLTNPWVVRLLTRIRTHPSGRFLRDFRGSNGVMPEGWRAGDGHWTACYRTLRGRLNIDLSTRPATIHVDGPLEPVPLNTAPLGLLIQLPEIGRKRAEAIITRRTALGGFKTLGQLSRVAHLNAKAIESLHAHCTLRRSSMLSRSAAAATRSATPRPPAR